jgi:hypothetical protein
MTPDRKKSKQEQIDVVRISMNRIEVNVDVESTESFNWEFTTAIQSARYPETKEQSQSTQEKNKPIHDQTSHFRTSFEYLVNYIIEIEEALGII